MSVAPPKRLVRTAGVLLHPTSLPGPHGIGDLGPEAHAWVDRLARARQSWWQVLPLGPTGYGDSPYQCFSAFAGNVALVSPDLLVEDGLLTLADLGGASFPSGRVDYGTVVPYKVRLLRLAWSRFRDHHAAALGDELDAFSAAEAAWLDDFALFMALKEAHGGGSWLAWDEPLRRREPETMQRLRTALREDAAEHRFRQFLFFRQWRALRRHAHERGVRILGDLPIFVAQDSADVWAHPDLFLLDEHRLPRVVAGVPPDYFSATGQLWGNPHYDWEAMARTGFAWWTERLRSSLALVDRVRVDHFRGFESAWQVESGRETAEVGAWVPGPGAALFEAMAGALGLLPIVAEDLGVITPEVDALREQLEFPGMRVLQFAFGGDADNPFLPYNHDQDCVVYTGTHDNDTTRGWWANLPAEERARACAYLGTDGSDIAWDLLRLAWSSVGETAIVPFQDVLDLGSEARMNLPGTGGGNWAWRFEPEQCTEAVLERLASVTELFGRAPRPPVAD